MGMLLILSLILHTRAHVLLLFMMMNLDARCLDSMVYAYFIFLFLLFLLLSLSFIIMTLIQIHHITDNNGHNKRS